MPSEGKSVMNRLPEIKIKDGRKFFLRFTLHQRIQHAILAISVIILVLTGMPLKFHDAFWAPYLYNLFGGIRIAPVVHKAAGTVLTLLFLYHIIYIITTLYAGYILPLREKKGVGFFGIIMCLINHPLVPCDRRQSGALGNRVGTACGVALQATGGCDHLGRPYRAAYAPAGHRIGLGDRIDDHRQVSYILPQ